MTRGMCGHVFLMKEPDNNRLPQGAAREGRNLTLVFLYIADDVSRDRWLFSPPGRSVVGMSLLRLFPPHGQQPRLLFTSWIVLHEKESKISTAY